MHLNKPNIVIYELLGSLGLCSLVVLRTVNPPVRTPLAVSEDLDCESSTLARVVGKYDREIIVSKSDKLKPATSLLGKRTKPTARSGARTDQGDNSS